NTVPEIRTSLWRRMTAKLWGPVPWMLEAAILLQFVLHEYVEAAVIGVLLVFNAALGFVQESRAQVTLDALKARLAPMAVALRDGHWETIDAGDLVPGDLVKLTLGSIVPADVRLIEGEILLDQSMLTGESLPVEAQPGSRTYAGALTRRGAATAEVTATGARTKFGRTAQLVQLAHGPSSQQQAVLRVVSDLALFSASMVILQLVYATTVHMEAVETIPLVLTAVLAAIPVALPATFTLASAIAARALAGRGVLPTRLSAIDEAATMDVLCSDKTGTLTRNELAVVALHPLPGFDAQQLLELALLASADSGLDPVDAAIRQAAASCTLTQIRQRLSFLPFDPAQKMSEARVVDATGRTLRIVKGAYQRINELAAAPLEAQTEAARLASAGHRVLAIASGPPERLAMAGLIALSDPPRPDARELIAQLRSIGVRTVMVTGDAAPTADVVARAVGLDGAVFSGGPLPERLLPQTFDVYAGVFPEDKFHIVAALQSAGHAVGMCGDGANDAPALRQAQMGVAVSTATDVAKSAAGIVLTHPGLGGIVEAVRCGRLVYQRVLTYTLRSLTAKVNQMLFLTVGLVLTGHAVMTPMLMVLLMISGDFLAMSATTDRVRASPQPNAWEIGRVTKVAVVLGVCNALYCAGMLELATAHLGLTVDHGLRTFAATTLVFSNQAAFYVVRERRWLWSSRPSAWVLISSVTDIAIIAILAGCGLLIHALPWSLVGMLLVTTAVFAVALDGVKRLALRLAPLG
ncbi:MAG TPA: HAD-IC family P-type ATPase, partial [Steroidobacteraceae bacterium]|nr:HAD-IC family P-type ATPase [Steroidobacteraceae bacterium]